jgi:CheY-like chemotaxis protein
VANDKKPDVILLDIGMPGMNGYEVAKQLRARGEFADTLLVAITGYGRASDVKQTQSAGFDYHLVKPVDYEKLQAVLATRGAKSGLRGSINVGSGEQLKRWAGNPSSV